MAALRERVARAQAVLATPPALRERGGGGAAATPPLALPLAVLHSPAGHEVWELAAPPSAAQPHAAALAEPQRVLLCCSVVGSREAGAQQADAAALLALHSALLATLVNARLA
jgi:hypothetical protein